MNPWPAIRATCLLALFARVASAASIPDAVAPAWPESTLRAPDMAAGDTRGPAARAGRVDWLWVTRVSLESPSAVERAVERAKAMGVRGLLVQVIGRGDAWYRSDRLPRAEALANAPPGFDPLGEMIERAHASGLEVHAWINCCLVWSADHPPVDAIHVARAHPEWFAELPDGRSLLTIGPRGWKRLRIEGAWLSPADERVRVWVAGNVAEVARRYPVDGIHLDYIRTPGIDAGYDGATRVGFAMETGVDRAHPATRSAAERETLDVAFAAFEDRQVTALVRAVRESLEIERPGLPLSAAVRPDPVEAARFYGQPWTGWLTDGLLDRAFPMCYSPDTQTVLDQLEDIARRVGRDRVVPGIAVYNATPTRVASHLKGARALGYPELALYSYDALFGAPRYWERLSGLLTQDAAP
ncbi:MAG: glycoside hydrolase family 10 protein [Candidatus Eisenbacteria bacterium]